MRIITLEEHLSDDAINRAAAPVMARLAPYQKEAGQVPPPAHSDASRPQFLTVQEQMRALHAPPEERLTAMDRHGIDMQVLSYSDALQYAPAAEAPVLARAANDRLHRLAAQHPQHFAGFCTLPWQQVEAAVTELERCHDLGLTACLLIGRPGETAMLDDERYSPVLSTLARLRMPLYIHPGAPLPAVQQPYYGGLGDVVSARFSLFGWGWHNEAGIQVLRLILSGALDRHPELHLISGHWGEMVPFYLQRLDDTLPPEVTGLTRTISQTYRDQVWVTPSGMLTLPHFQFVREVLGTEHLLYSVDYPYLTMDGARAWLESLPISEDERAAFAHRNAERLLRIPALER